MASSSENTAAEQCCDIQLDLSNLSDLCTLMPRRLLVTGILIQVLRRKFSKKVGITNPLLHATLWSDEISDTKIVIDSVFKWNPAQTETRPGIFIKPGAWRVQSMGIEDRKMPGGHGFNSITVGSHTVFCVAGESAEVEILSTEVYKDLMMFSSTIRRMFGFLRFKVADIGEPAILEEATENFVVPITVSYGVQDIWRVCTPECFDILNEVILDLHTHLGMEDN